MSENPSSKRQRKFAEAKSRNMTKGQLWRARERKSKVKNVNSLKGKKSILIITNRNRERIGANEAIALLGLDDAGSSDDDEDEEKEGSAVDMQAQLEKELEVARSTRKKINRFDIGMSCLTLVQVPTDPLELVSKVFNSVIEEGKAKSTHIEKLIPFQIVCHSSLDSILQNVRELMKNTFTEDGPSKSFAIMPRIRGSPPPAAGSSSSEIVTGDNEEVKDKPVESVLDRNVLITSIAELIDQKKHPVDLTEPDIVIIVEVLRSITGITIVSGEDYRKFKRFHLRAMTDPSVKE
jgi:tRNA acetyltransferase TAN1